MASFIKILFVFLISILSLQVSAQKNLDLVGKQYTKQTKSTKNTESSTLKFIDKTTAELNENGTTKLYSWKNTPSRIILFDSTKKNNIFFKKSGKKLMDSKKNMWINMNTQETITPWFVDRILVNSRPVGLNPEEGGADFMKINSDHTAEYKVGDMIENMKWTLDKNQLIMTNTLTERKIVFIVNKNHLLDEYKTKWSLK